MVDKNKQIKLDIMKRLTLLSFKNYSNINIAVDNGWVFIGGSVKKKTERDVVEKIASNVLGVQTVINKITIVPTHDELDKSIAEEVVEAIDMNKEVNVEHVIVQVQNQVITLDGSVPNWRSKDQAYEAAHSIEHAESINVIKNELRVTHG